MVFRCALPFHTSVAYVTTFLLKSGDKCNWSESTFLPLLAVFLPQFLKYNWDKEYVSLVEIGGASGAQAPRIYLGPPRYLARELEWPPQFQR